VTVTAAKVPSPAPSPLPSTYAAQVVIATDVPFDTPHVVTLGETPLGDQLAFTSVGPIRFGQVPIGTSLTQTFAITNNANPGSPPANLSFAVNGDGAGAYGVTPLAATVLPGGHTSSPESVSFAPGSATPYPAGVAIVTSDAQCTPLPAPLALGGTGTQGKVALSAAAIAFGTDPNDGSGLVNCGATGRAHDLTISNVGNQTFHITGAMLARGSSRFALSGSGTQPNAAVAIGQSVTITITPSPIPATVPDPNDASLFADVLTLTTDAARDAPHDVKLVMRARGAVIASTPLATTWSFGTVASGSIATYTSALRNTGNSAVTISMHGLTQPAIFGLRSDPTNAVANAVTSVVGQFAPPSANGTWSDRGTLTVEAVDALCAPLPAQWAAPTIDMSGSSNAGSPIAVSGNLEFPPTDCGSASPAARAVTLASSANVPYAYSSRLATGLFYSVANGSGTLPPNGLATIVITPVTVTPGPSTQPGAAPYADDLLVTIATTPPTSYTIPIAWALNGAVLKLPLGAGPNVDAQGNAFYVADTLSGFTLPMANAGNATATIAIGVEPAGAFTLSPAPLDVLPGITVAPVLTSASANGTCPTLTAGRATFVYSGAICQPFPFSSVSVRSCVGTYR
jgi:hypothetical protein